MDNTFKKLIMYENYLKNNILIVSRRLLSDEIDDDTKLQLENRMENFSNFLDKVKFDIMYARFYDILLNENGFLFRMSI